MTYNDAMLSLQRKVAKAARASHIREHGRVPKANPLSNKRPFYAKAGDNKIRCRVCATCGKPPTRIPSKTPNFILDERPVFPMRDDLSVKEYSLSGMCQDCQDSVFGRKDTNIRTSLCSALYSLVVEWMASNGETLR